MAPAVLKRPDQKADTVESVNKAGRADRSDAIARPNVSGDQMNESLLMQWHELCFCLTAAHVFYAPYTKVEETPALHAVHDILTYGIGRQALQKYEHVLYPGAVPRSFVPSLVVAALSKPVIWLGARLNMIQTGLHMQMTTRLVLAMLFAASLSHMASTLHRSSPLSAKAFLLFSLSQFHVPFYAGRFLPNFLALPPVIFAFSLILRALERKPVAKTSKAGSQTIAIPKEHSTRMLSFAVSLLTFIGAVVRLELAPIAVTVAAVLFLQSRLTLAQTASAGAVGGMAGLDSYFYYPTSHTVAWWPELSAFIFNIPQGKAADWGVMPWYQYFVDLPRLLMASLPLAMVYPVLHRDKAARTQMAIIGLPCIAIVGALSCVGHKEWRFLAYVVPLVNVLAAKSAGKLWGMGSQMWNSIIRLGLIGMFCANIAVTVLLSIISEKNYAGGQIGSLLENLTQGQAAKIWVPAAALHSGATVYTLPPTINIRQSVAGNNITIVRPESSYEASRSPSGNSPSELWEEKYDWVVTDDWKLFTGDHVEEGKKGWEMKGEVEGYKGLGILRKWPFLEIRSGRALAVVKRVEE